MTVYFMGSEMSAFLPSDSTVYEQTNAYAGNTLYEEGFQRCTVGAYADSFGEWETPTLGSLTTAWIHRNEAFTAFDAAENTIFWVENAASTIVFKCVGYQTAAGTRYYKFYTLSGASFVAVGDPVAVTQDQRQSMDTKLTTTGFEFYIAGTYKTGGTIAIDNIDKVGWTYPGMRISGVIIASESTIGWTLACWDPTANGAQTSWGGSYTAIDELVYADADGISGAANGDVSTFTHTGQSYTGYTVKAVGLAARAKKGVTGPANLQGVLRISSTNYASSSKALGTGYSPNVFVWDTDPSTAAAWGTANPAALEFGVKAVT